MAGQEYRPIAFHRRTGSNPIFITGSISLVADNPQVMAQPLSWLMFITLAMGKYLMNEYEIFMVQIV
jgi:hypothetical protein